MLFVSCKKQNCIEITKLYGKWKLVEVYDVYGGGGSNGWYYISGDWLRQIEFTQNGEYSQADSYATLKQCSGSFRMPAQNKVEIFSNCDPAIENFTITELTDANLVIDQLGTEGIIRYKYKKQ